MQESFETDSNVSVESDEHPPKQSAPSVSTEDGMQIDDGDEHPESARSGMQESFEPDSNITIESD
jgi:hypothetical protein